MSIKRKIGRPRKAKRGRILTAYVSQAADKAIRAKAEREGRPISSIVDEAIMGMGKAEVE